MKTCWRLAADAEKLMLVGFRAGRRAKSSLL